MKRMCVLVVLFVLFSAGCAGCPGCKSRSKTSVDADWGTLTDPNNDCAIQFEKTRLTITVPGTPHDLNPQLGQTAPRVLQEVSGDFVVSVKVSGDLDPGNSGFNGAGLLVWGDARNYVRLERNRYWVPGQGRLFCYPPLFEYYRNGQYQNTNPEPTPVEFFGAVTWLRLERKGNRLTAAYSHDGKTWSPHEITVELPSKVQVGVAAVNTSQKPFTPVFEEFSLGQK